MPPTTGRQAWADTLRGLAIGLMVFGHVVGGVATARPGDPAADLLWAAYRYIYAFHMPAFLWVSGVFAPASLRRSGRAAFLLDKLRTLAYPYLLWGLITWGCHAVMRGHTNSPFDPLTPVHILFNPAAGFWFLYVLLLLMGGLAAVGPSAAGRLLFTAAAAGGYGATAWGMTADWPPAAGLAARHALWFAAGLWSARPAAAAARLPPAALLPAAGLGFAAVAALDAPLVDTAARGTAAAAAGTAALFALSAAGAGTAAGRAAGVAGRHSLEIYVASGIPSVLTRLLLVKGTGVTAFPALIVACTAVGVGSPLALVWLARRLGVRRLFRWPPPRP